MTGALTGSGCQAAGLLEHPSSSNTGSSGISLNPGDLLFRILPHLVDSTLATLLFLTRQLNVLGPGLCQFSRLLIPFCLPGLALTLFTG